MSSLNKALNLTNEERRSLEKTVGRVRSVSEFLSDAVDAVKDLDFVEAVQKASPWAEAVGGSLADAFPAVKFVVKLIGRLTGQTDPNGLAMIAFTTAYQQSLNEAIRTAGRPNLPFGDANEVKKKLRDFDDSIPTNALEFSGLSLERALEHPFVEHADGMLAVAAEGAGYDEPQRRDLQRRVHRHFVSALKMILSHGDTTEKFEPLRRKLALGTAEWNAYEALSRHAQYQRALFQESPVFGKEAFPLSDIYVDSECGVKDWGPLNDTRDEQGRKLDAFDESCGGRYRIGETVLGYLRNPEFRDAVVIQGLAGAGKSAFTQWLAAKLANEGLQPIRILMRHVPLERDRPIEEALGAAIRYTDEGKAPQFPRPEDPLLKNRIFNEPPVQFGDAMVSPYVLILDAWDEISISVPEGFKVRLNRFLEKIRSEYLHPNRTFPVRVILTGRPSAEVAESTFMKTSTPLLTLRPWNPDDLASYFTKLAKAVNARPLKDVEGTKWPTVDPARFMSAIESYRKGFDAMLKQKRSQHTYSGSGSTLEILGMPLLAFLAARLLTEATEESAKTVLENPTTLFRNLLDLTCSTSGRYSGDDDRIGPEFKYRGNELRELLRHTATAMTVYGKENISYDELELRLDLEGIDVQPRVDSDTADNPLSQLIVSYYFKGGHTDLGCEFLHKSFREYLFAEEVVEMLKEYGRANADRPLSPRDTYWADFAKSDPRYDFSRAIANRLGAQWLTPEVVRYLGNLLEWEIRRATGKETSSASTVGDPTRPLSIPGWESVRDALADLWDWWGEGVPMRPQPTRDKKQPFEDPLAFQVLVNRIMPRATEKPAPIPPRLNIVDSHLGDALFRLNVTAHFQIAFNTGWADFEGGEISPKDMWQIVEEKPRKRPCQVEVQREEKRWRLFAPTGTRGEYWTFYSARITGAGWRPFGRFPDGSDIRGIFFRNVEILSGGQFANWRYSHLLECWLENGALSGTRFDSAYLVRLGAVRCDFSLSSFEHAVIDRSVFSEGNFSACNFGQAVITQCNFDAASLLGTRWRNAVLTDVHFRRADVRAAKFEGVRGNVLLDEAIVDEMTIRPDGTPARPPKSTES